MIEFTMESLVIVLVRLFFVTATSHVLNSPVLYNYGTWGSWEECPKGLYASGFQLKVEPYRPAKISTCSMYSGCTPNTIFDNTQLNGIRLICSSIGDNDFASDRPSSNVGRHGYWRSVKYCDHGVMVGFQYRSDSYVRGNRDSTAGNNFRGYCAGTGNKKYWIEGDGPNLGSYTAEQMCPPLQAIRAIRTQVDLKNKARGKDTIGLVNIQMRCDDIIMPIVECTPVTKFQLVLECNNLNATSSLECIYEAKVGVAKSTIISSSQSSREEALKSIGFSAEISNSIAEGKFSTDETWIGETGVEEGDVTSDFWMQELTRSVELSVPRNHITRVYKVTGTCDVLEVRSIEFIINQISGPLPNPIPETGFVCDKPPDSKRITQKPELVIQNKRVVHNLFDSSIIFKHPKSNELSTGRNASNPKS